MGNVGRCKMIKQLLNINEGDYFEKRNPTVVRKSSGLEYFRVKAWRLEPLAKAMITPEKSPVSVKVNPPRSDNFPRHSGAGILRSSSKESSDSYFENRRQSSHGTPKSSVMYPQVQRAISA